VIRVFTRKRLKVLDMDRLDQERMRPTLAGLHYRAQLTALANSHYQHFFVKALFAQPIQEHQAIAIRRVDIQENNGVMVARLEVCSGVRASFHYQGGVQQPGFAQAFF